MSKPSDRLDRMRIASPCSVEWERMVGDDRMRFCDQCGLNVYNISSMTGRQVKALVEKTEGRLCARLYRRADGTILTRDCPVGLRAIRRRVSRVAGAAFTAMMSLCVSVFGQNPSQVCARDSENAPLKIKRTRIEPQSQDDRAALSGIVIDPAGASVPGVSVTLISENSKEEQAATANDDGRFEFLSLVAGSYTLKFRMSGFRTLTMTHIKVGSHESLRVDANLEVNFDGETGTIGIVLLDTPAIDLSTTSVTHRINTDSTRHLPIPE
jgi:hypothetical protein